MATKVLLDVNDALDPCLEGIAFADEVAAGVNRVVMAAAAGSRHAVISEANRLGFIALRSRAEFRRMAADIEGPDAA